MLSLLWLVLAATPAAPTPPSESPPQDVEPAFLAFATDLRDSLQAGDPSLLDERVDLDRLLQRATRDLPASQAVLDALLGDVRETGLKLGGALLGSKKDHTDRVHLLRVESHQGAPRAILRVLSSGALNYFAFELARDERGRVVIVDVYPFMAGELLSESLRRVYLMAALEKAPEAGKKRTGRERGVMDNMPRFQRIHRLLDEERYQEAMDELSRLPPAVLAEKSFQLIRLKALMRLGEPRYQRALRAYEKAFPEDAVMDLLALDDARLDDKPEERMRVLDRLDRKVGDPYLHYLRAEVKLQQDDVPAAKRFLLRAIQGDPTLYEPYMELLSLTIGEGDYAQAILVLEGLERGVGADVMRLEVSDAGFLASPEYREWLRRQNQKGKYRLLRPRVPPPTGGEL
jgi:tetratricopeptide (TPR) repeat protein